MPSRLDSPVLSLSINNIRKVDTTNVDNLFGMWTIFSKCAESLENGRRLENLSWRLWNRETFVCNDLPSQVARSSSSLRLSENKGEISIVEEIPDLSASVDSVESRHSERHMSPIHLAKLYENISNDDPQQAEQEWASMKKAASQVISLVPVSNPSEEHFTTSSAHSTSSNDSVTSQSSAVSEVSANSVVRGFSEGQVSTSYRSSPKSTPEEHNKVEMAVEKIEQQMMIATAAPIKAVRKTKMFEIGSNTSDEAGSMDSHFDGSLTRQKRAAFVDEVTTRTVVYPPEDDDDYVSEENESAIDDDDDASDWEDSLTESGQSSYAEDNMFERMEETKPVLPSRRSLLSMLMQQPEETAVLANARPSIVRSRTSSPNGPSCAPSPGSETPAQLEGASAISRAKPILVNASQPRQIAYSPRTTRRNMLATELTESLRKHLLWERQQKNQTANAVLKRRHTAHEMSTLNEYPQGQEGSRHNSWNNFFEQGLAEYHVAGW